MYKVASDNRQRALHQGAPRDWVNGEEKLSLEDQLAQLVEGINIIQDRILLLPKGEERTELGRQKLALQQKVGPLRKLVGRERVCKQGIDQVFITTAREMLPKVQFQIIWRAAEREYASRQAELTGGNDGN